MSKDIITFIDKIYNYKKKQIKDNIIMYKDLFNIYKSFDFYNLLQNNETYNEIKYDKKLNKFYLDMIDNNEFDISFIDNNNDSLLHYMCKKNNITIANKLIDYFKNNNSDLYNHENDELDTPFDIVLENDRSDDIAFNLIELYQLKSNDYIQEYCLVKACFFNNLKIANKILEYPIKNINQEYCERGNPLSLACENNYAKIVLKLLDYDSCDYKCNDYEFTPLMLACERNSTNIVKKILSKPDCDLNYINKTDNKDRSAICFAYKNKEIMKLLINKGCEIDMHYNIIYIPDFINELKLEKLIEKFLFDYKINSLYSFIVFLNIFNEYNIEHEDIDTNNKRYIIYYDNVLNNMIRKEERFKFCFTNKKNVLLFICKNSLYFHLNKTVKRIIKMLTLHDIQIKDKNGYSIIDIIYNLNNEKLIDLVYKTFNYKRDKCNKDCIICYNNDMGYFLDCTKCKNSYHSKCFWDFYNVSGNKKCLLCFSENTLF